MTGIGNVLYICSPYMGSPYAGSRSVGYDNIANAARIESAARSAVEVATQAGWIPICPALYNSDDRHEVGVAMVYRLCADTDLVVCLDGWDRDPRSAFERQVALSRGLSVYELTDSGDIKCIKKRALCPHYREVHYETSDRDTCDMKVTQCPPGGSCPIRVKVYKRPVR